MRPKKKLTALPVHTKIPKITDFSSLSFWQFLDLGV